MPPTHSGVDVIECDIHEYRGRVEVRHLKSAGPLPFLWDKWELASASAPRLGLEELLEAGRHGSTFMLDLKGRRVSTARAVAKLLHEGPHDRPVLACGRYWPSLDALASLPYVKLVLSARSQVELTHLRHRVSSGSPVHGVSVHWSLLDEKLVAELHDHVRIVMTWPINTVARLDDMLAMGVTGIISDEQDVLAELISRRA